MKKITLFSFTIFFTLLFCYQASFAQSNNRDSVENKIRNQFIKAVNAAATNSTTFSSYFENLELKRQREVTTYTGQEALDICLESIKYYIDNNTQVVENLIGFENPKYVLQSISLITIETDTSKGFAIDGIPNGPQIPKHMDMELRWNTDSNDNWKITYFYRTAGRERQ